LSGAGGYAGLNSGIAKARLTTFSLVRQTSAFMTVLLVGKNNGFNSIGEKT
jgi:hypothetical protein